MHARVTTLDMDPSKVDELRDRLEENDVPEFKKLDCFKGMTLLTDRQTGKTIAVTFWESEDALRQSEEAVKDHAGGPRNLAAPASRRWSASRSSSTRSPPRRAARGPHRPRRRGRRG
jgi:heme-degrading monooxygenase HmoA